MLRYIGKRILLTLPTLLLVSLIVFTLIRLVPGDPAQVLLGEDADKESIAALHEQLGLNHSLPFQYLHWLSQSARGNLGKSISTGENVAALIASRLQVSAIVALTAVSLATLIAIGAGMIAAWRPGTALDFAVLSAASLVLAIPSFWLGMILLLVFGLRMEWFPVVGYIPFSESAKQWVLYLVLPILTLTIVEMGVLTRMMRSSSLDVLKMEYITHARAKGLSEFTVLSRHVFPNAFAPTMTLVGLTLGQLLGGIAVIETVFTLPGLGRLMVDGILSRDYPVVQGCLLLTGIAYVAINLIVDLCYPLFDPRVTANR
jgi:peptide/nickel transport system permease protein